MYVQIFLGGMPGASGQSQPTSQHMEPFDWATWKGAAHQFGQQPYY